MTPGAPDRAKRRTGSPAAGTVYAIGDIHGCYDLMVGLLERIVADVDRANAQDETTLVFLGDYIDRGPATADVLAALVWLERNSPLPTVFLKGNHEQIMLDYIDHPPRPQHWFRFGGRTTLRSYGVELPEELASDADHQTLRDRIVDHLPASHLDFLRRLRMFHENEHFVFVHAGIRMGVPLRDQKTEDLLWIRKGFLEERRAGGKRIVHGHTWVDDKPAMLAHRIGVDTGAFKTGVLTAARLQGETVGFISTADPG
ncbi:MAG: metallophosphoesterase family protein [Sphingomonas sp.]